LISFGAFKSNLDFPKSEKLSVTPVAVSIDSEWLLNFKGKFSEFSTQEENRLQHKIIIKNKLD
jgi:hypothetical protein